MITLRFSPNKRIPEWKRLIYFDCNQIFIMNFSYGFRFFGSIIFTAILIVLATGYWESPWNNFLGMVVYLLGFAVWFMGNNRIGESFSFKPMAKKLVTEGIY